MLYRTDPLSPDRQQLPLGTTERRGRHAKGRRPLRANIVGLISNSGPSRVSELVTKGLPAPCGVIALPLELDYGFDVAPSNKREGFR